MNRNKSDLILLLDTVDSWFSDKAYKVPLRSHTECTLDEDQAKLAQITKTTLRWFGGLTHSLTDEGIEEEEEDSEAVEASLSHQNQTNPTSNRLTTEQRVLTQGKTRKLEPRPSVARPKKLAPRKEKNIDQLAKDLERILEQTDENPISTEPLIEYFDAYFDNHLALLDKTIGASYTLHSNNNLETKPVKLSEASKWSCLTDNSKLVNNNFSSLKTRRNLLKNSHTYSQFKPDRDSRQVQTPCLLADHDYFAKIPVKPLVLNNRLLQSARQTQIHMPVLNMAALKLFARFSNQFKHVSVEHDKISATCNE